MTARAGSISSGTRPRPRSGAHQCSLGGHRTHLLPYIEWFPSFIDSRRYRLTRRNRLTWRNRLTRNSNHKIISQAILVLGAHNKKV